MSSDAEKLEEELRGVRLDLKELRKELSDQMSKIMDVQIANKTGLAVEQIKIEQLKAAQAIHTDQINAINSKLIGMQIGIAEKFGPAAITSTLISVVAAVIHWFIIKG